MTSTDQRPVANGLKRIDRQLESMFDWLTGLPMEEATALRGDLLRTVMLAPIPLVLSSVGILVMSATALVVTGALWAKIWFALDLILMAARLYTATTSRGRAEDISAALTRRIVCIAFAVFLLFGVGCAVSLYTAIAPLPLVSTASMMGLVAGVATRWAALPRLAIVSIILFSTPFLGTMIFMGDGAEAGAAQLAIVIAGTSMLTLQNQRTLITMLRAERQARALASTDSLTGLGNRSALEADLKILEEASHLGRDPAFAALFIDLDHFKRINDEHGHAAGDQVLRETAARLRTAAAPHPVYRVGGDEFLVLAPEQQAIAELLCESIADLLCHPMQNPPLHGGIKASIGIAHGDVHEQSAEHIIARADHALYGIKRSRATEWRKVSRDSSPAAQLSILARSYPR